MLELQQITKSFGPVPALASVSLSVQPGEIHGLLGENGAGKTTLMNILFGLLRPDAGRILLAGRPVLMTSPRIARQHGIGMVHQQFKLVGRLSVLENFLLALQPGGGLLDRAGMAARVHDVFARLGWQIDPDARVDTLSTAWQQRVEIARALAGGGRVLILDEPTSVLTPPETAELFAALRALAGAGTAIVFISHRLAEVRQACTHLTILRRGGVVASAPAQSLSDAQIADHMIGGPLPVPQRRPAAAPATASPAAPALELRNISVHGPTGRQLDRVSCTVSAGQIVGIAGVAGNGQDALVQTIVGTRRPDTGQIIIDGHDATTTSVRWRTDRLAFVPDDRPHQGLVLPLSIQQNLLLKQYRRPPFSTLGLLHAGQWRTHAAALVQRFAVRGAALADPVGTLSGGNQQKVVLARELSGHPRLVIAVNPTQGLDIGAAAFVLQQLLDARAAGAAVLLIHNDLDELLAVSDRILVLFNGTLCASPWPQASKESIGRLMLGVP